MAYKVIIGKTAVKQVISSTNYYDQRSTIAAENFMQSFSDSVNILKESPHFQKRYGNIRSILLKKFPFSVYFSINERKKVV